MSIDLLQVLTYNIHKGFSVGKLRFMLPKMRDAIASVNTDVVFLQEVLGEHKGVRTRLQQLPEDSQFEFLAEQLWPHYAYAKNAIYQAGHHGNAILSKYPIIFWENINVSTSSRASRSLLHGIISIPDNHRKVHVICAHLGLLKSQRKDQIDILCQRIEEKVPHTESLILAGDFNDWRQDAQERLHSGLELKEVFMELRGSYAKSFPAVRPTLQTDRIYYRGLTLETGKILSGKPWRLLSDHLPLYAAFRL